MKYFKSNKYSIELVLTENIEKNFILHNHINHYIIAVIICGNVFTEIDGYKTKYSDNDTYIIPPYVPHSISLTKDVKMLSLCIGISFVEQYKFDDAQKIIATFLQKLSVYNDMVLQIKSLLYCIKNIYKLKKLQTFKSENNIKDLANKIVSQPEQKLSLDELAKISYISKYYLLKKFKQNIGLTPHQFHIQNKIRKSQNLLSNKKSILDISVEMGFYDQSHFDKSFQKIVGISPTEYIVSQENID